MLVLRAKVEKYFLENPKDDGRSSRRPDHVVRVPDCGRRHPRSFFGVKIPQLKQRISLLFDAAAAYFLAESFKPGLGKRGKCKYKKQRDKLKSYACGTLPFVLP